MSPARVVVLCVGLAALTFGAVWGVLRLRGDGAEAASPRDGEVSVATAAALPRDERVVVRGFLFVDERTGPVLCQLSVPSGDRPACDGSFVRLLGLDLSRFALERASSTEGGYDAWSDSEVVLLGTTVGGAGLRVEDVLPT